MMARLRDAVLVGVGCAIALGCDPTVIDDILKGHGPGGPGSSDGGAGGSTGTERCGGTTANAPKCPAGFDCVPDPANGNLPDVGGICVKANPPPPVQHCGGIAAIRCPGNGQCVDDPNDGCDPAAGGADCGGICTCVQKVLCPRGATFDGSPSVCACVPTAPPPPPPGACMPGKCPGPMPAGPNQLCPDGHHVSGPACVVGADGSCGWAFLTCP